MTNLDHYPDAVVGMVLAGPTHENTRLFFTADNQWKRVRDQPSPMGGDFQELYLARQTNPAPLGDRPLILSRGSQPLNVEQCQGSTRSILRPSDRTKKIPTIPFEI
jgi:hypothetical protein